MSRKEILAMARGIIIATKKEKNNGR